MNSFILILRNLIKFFLQLHFPFKKNNQFNRLQQILYNANLEASMRRHHGHNHHYHHPYEQVSKRVGVSFDIENGWLHCNAMLFVL